MDPDADHHPRSSPAASSDEGGGGGRERRRGDRERDRDRRGADPREAALPNSSRRVANARGGERSRRGDGRDGGSSVYSGRPPHGSKSKASSSSRRGEDEKLPSKEKERRRGDHGRSSVSGRGGHGRRSDGEASDPERTRRSGDEKDWRREKRGSDDRRRRPQSSREANSESDKDIAEDKPSYSQYLINEDEGGDGDVKDEGGEVVEYVEEEEEDSSAGDEDHSFQEDIEDANYNEHCGDTTYVSKKSSKSKQTIRKDYRGEFDDSELEELIRGDDSQKTREYAQIGYGKDADDRSKHSHRGNSPELNPDHQRQKEEDEELLRIARSAKEYGADRAGGVADEGALVSTSRQRSSDPPSAHEVRSGNRSKDHRPSTPDNMDPHDDDQTLLSRFDAPPSPAGPERNLERNPLRDKVGEAGASGTPGGSTYSNYMLDEEGRRQAQEVHGQTGALVEVEQGLGKVNLRSSLRGQDPPERGQGLDPKQVGLNDPPDRSGGARSSRSRGGKSDKYRKGSKGGSRREEASSSRRKKEREKTKEKKPPPPKSILKKRDAPIPITRFGKPVDGASGHAMNSSGHSGGGSATDTNDDDDAGDSDPEVTERKATRPADDHGDGGDAKDERSVMTGKSGLRSGKYAALNAAAANRNDENEDEDESDGEGSFSSRGHYFSESEAELGTDRSDAEEEEDDDDQTFKSIVSTADSRFDRANSHFLRTADLGLTQDTIFAEQFLDEPGAKPEPHYHHPSPHPPPGVQFHIDENWVCLDDGRGGHSPIAPQAVDALVAMGYRAACDPMMWTPTSKTRKYMTEKGLRFDDVPIPGPLDEGEGGPGDSQVLVWSGKFPHKYHGHEQPAIRSQGIVNMSPEDLVDLLMDSERVSEYNKSSIGRFDEVVLSDGRNLDSCPFSGQRKKKLSGVVMMGATIIDGTAVLDSETDDEQSDMEEIIEEVFDDHGGKSVRTISTSSSSRREPRQSHFVGVTKLVRTQNKPPLVRKVLEFFTLLHCRALTDDQGGDGYIIVGRGAIPGSDAEKSGKAVMHSEILLNVHIVRRLRNSRSRRGKDGKGSGRGRNVSTSGRKASKSDLAHRCLMINVTHLKSPMVPKMLAKKVGLSAALNFISDIRALTE